MSDEKQERTNLMADLQLVIGPLLQFIIINASFLLLIVLLAVINKQNIEDNSPSAVLFVLLIFSLLIIYPITFYLFQKKYALLKKAPYKINRMGPYFLRLLQIYIIQYLIIFALLLGIMIIFSLMSSISKQVSNILTPIITFGLIIFGIYWFYRLFFVPYILIFKRSNYASGNIILESKFLIKKNIAFILLVLLLPILVSIPSALKILKNHGVPQINYLSIIIGIATQLVSYVGCIFITINEVCRNSVFASELVKSEES